LSWGLSIAGCKFSPALPVACAHHHAAAIGGLGDTPAREGSGPAGDTGASCELHLEMCLERLRVDQQEIWEADVTFEQRVRLLELRVHPFDQI
jgi:hypothetical protein